ncbi:MAG: transcriptional regulator [Coleofasciculaceae cyanobacterium SM2_1_6]|nr:transcriptional regulator [Coleofasciculaceae cyanobacterium SM2_1_6]
MSINLTLDQEKLIKAKLESGKYQTPEEVISNALRLLDEYERSEAAWVAEVRTKIDEAILASEETPSIDGETFINEILERFANKRKTEL